MTSVDTPAFFIVACMGHSGSSWLAAMLNAHPDIVCSHSYAPPPFSIAGDPAAQVAPVPQSAAEWQRRLAEGRHRAEHLSLDDLFNELICYAEGRAYGNVHMHNIRTLLASARRLPPANPIKVANLIRHPLAWTDSRSSDLADRIDQYQAVDREIRSCIDAHREIFEPIVAEYGLDPTDRETAAFLAATTNLGGLMEDALAWPDTWFVQMEHLTTDRAAFARFVREITGGGIEPEADYLDTVFASGRRNAHSTRSGMTPEERYAGWKEWQRRVFDTMFHRFHVGEIYGKLGYDMGFVE